MLKRTKSSKKLGRDQEVADEDLVRRYAAMKRVLEDNWGRLGLRLPRVRKPDDVMSILNLVHDAEWCPAFRDFPTGCLLRKGGTNAGWRKVRATRYKFDASRREENELSPKSQTANQEFERVKSAFEGAHRGKKEHQLSERERAQLHKIAKQLRIEELSRDAQTLGELLRVAQTTRQSLEDQLSAEEAWFARYEVVAFVRDPYRRYSKTPENFAKAMAGLPFYDWLYSLRRCISIPAVASVPKTYWFQVFEMIQGIVRRTRSGDLRKIESRLKSELLKPGCDTLLRSFISPQWFYMTLAFEDCRGKGFRRAHIPYKVMEMFLDHWQKRSLVESEIANLNQLVAQDLQ
jgi:hypothetical protein